MSTSGVQVRIAGVITVRQGTVQWFHLHLDHLRPWDKKNRRCLTPGKFVVKNRSWWGCNKQTSRIPTNRFIYGCFISGFFLCVVVNSNTPEHHTQQPARIEANRSWVEVCTTKVSTPSIPYMFCGFIVKQATSKLWPWFPIYHFEVSHGIPDFQTGRHTICNLYPPCPPLAPHERRSPSSWSGFAASFGSIGSIFTWSSFTSSDPGVPGLSGASDLYRSLNLWP